MSKSIESLQESSISDDFLTSATGSIAIPMTNDYLFRAFLQSSNKALKGLICALLHLSPDEVQSVEITNPIELGKAVDEKTFLLDVKVLLNGNTIINLEMQVINELNWPERSLSYLCRSFDNLASGMDYSLVKPVIQIGILGFTLFPEYPEFYATYQMLNVRNYTLYSDKLRLSVVDLKHIDLATAEDKAYGIDRWAALLKAATWEEVKMIAQQDEYIKEASDTVYRLSQEEKIRQQCEAREDYYRRQHGIQRRLERLEYLERHENELVALMEKQEVVLKEREFALDKQRNEMEVQRAEIEDQRAEIEDQRAEIEDQRAEIEDQRAEIEDQKAEIENQKAKIEDQRVILEMQKAELEEQKAKLAEKSFQMAEQAQAIEALQMEIVHLKRMIESIEN